jgi:hypothetical protein
MIFWALETTAVEGMTDVPMGVLSAGDANASSASFSVTL